MVQLKVAEQLHRIAESNHELVARSRPLLSQLRVKLAGLILATLLVALVLLAVPLPFTSVGPAGLTSPNILASLAMSEVAAVLGYYMIAQVSGYPASQATSYVFPLLLTSYAALAVLMFLFRIDYSRFIIIGSFAMSLAWLLVVTWFNDIVRVPVLAIVPGGNQRDVASLRMARWHRLSSPSESTKRFDGIVADLQADLPDDWEVFISICIIKGIPVYDVKHLREIFTGQVELEHLAENNFGAVLPSRLYLKAKRLVDILAALLALPFFLAAIAVTACIVKLDSQGPVFFKQERYGFKGKVFPLLKIRSMHVGSDKLDAFTQSADSRVTRVGAFIRKYRIDELPQIFNILRGDMSWIGPRPESVRLAERYVKEVPFYLYRYAVRPGLSGWAQVSQGNVGAIDDEVLKLRYDFYYVKNVSPWLDVLITARTLFIVLSGFGSK